MIIGGVAMAINVNTANMQAGQISSYANQLRNAKNQLYSYKSSIIKHWQGREVSYITRGIDQTIAQIDSVIRQLNSLSTDLKNTAATIKQEDDAAAAAARARAERQQRIQTAQTNYNNSIDECDKLYTEKDTLQKLCMENSFASDREPYETKLGELTRKIEEAERKRNDYYIALAAARR